jgi:fermentation-respiration switch protein FrsA (DUF1100 family)
MKKMLKKLAAVTAILYLSVIGYLYLEQRSLLYFPLKESLGLKGSNLGETLEVFLTTPDGVKIQTWYHSPKAGKPLVIYLHGNSYNLEYRKAKFRELLDMGFGFVAPAWRGFSASEGTPTKEGLYIDARTAIDFAESMGYKTDDIILIGESLGTGIAVQMATEKHFKGLFLITPYTSISDRAQEIYWYLPVKHLIKDNFISIDKISKINTPVLIVHGDEDDVIPHHHSEKLFKEAQEPKELIIYPGKSHNNLDNNVIFKELKRFFKVEDLEDEHYAQN